MHFSAIVPLVLSMAAFAMTLVLVLSGSKPGSMEEVHVVRLNVSMLGHNLIDISSDDGSDTGSGTLDKWIDGARDGLNDLINGVGNDIADRLADEIGISQWYSLHLMSVCQGDFSPNATASDAGLNITDCTKASPGPSVNLTEMLDHQLSVGPLKLNLADLDWPKDITKTLETLNRILKVVFILYVLAIALSGVAMFGALAGLFGNFKRRITLPNFVVTLLASIVLLVPSLIITIAGKTAVNKFKEMNNLEVSVEMGITFVVLSWTSFAAMVVAAVYWFSKFCLERPSRRRSDPEKKHAKGSF